MSPESLWAVLGWSASAVVVTSLCQTNLVRLRILNLIGSVLAMAYNLPLAVWPAVGLHTSLALINVVHLVRISRARRQAAVPVRVVDVATSDALLLHLLDAHRGEIEDRMKRALEPVLRAAGRARVAVTGSAITGVALREGDSWVLAYGTDPGMLLDANAQGDRTGGVRRSSATGVLLGLTSQPRRSLRNRR